MADRRQTAQIRPQTVSMVCECSRLTNCRVAEIDCKNSTPSQKQAMSVVGHAPRPFQWSMYIPRQLTVRSGQLHFRGSDKCHFAVQPRPNRANCASRVHSFLIVPEWFSIRHLPTSGERNTGAGGACPLIRAYEKEPARQCLAVASFQEQKQGPCTYRQTGRSHFREDARFRRAVRPG